MSPKSLRCTYTTVLAVLALWPAAQWYLVEQHDVNPWKFCGFAMYCTPHRVVVDVHDTSQSESRQLSEQQLEAMTGGEYTEFLEWRTQFGTLHSPADFAQAVLRASPEIQSIRVDVHVLQLDPATATVAVRSKSYDYRDTGTYSVLR